jgi:hypothetical protein
VSISWEGPQFHRIPINQVDRFDRLDPDQHQTVRIYRDWWWLVTPDDEILLFDRRVPQANPQREVTELMCRKYPGCKVRQLPLIILPEEV